MQWSNLGQSRISPLQNMEAWESWVFSHKLNWSGFHEFGRGHVDRVGASSGFLMRLQQISVHNHLGS